MASRRGCRRSEYLDLAYSRAAFSAERGAADDWRRRQFGDRHLRGDGGGRGDNDCGGFGRRGSRGGSRSGSRGGSRSSRCPLGREDCLGGGGTERMQVCAKQMFSALVDREFVYRNTSYIKTILSLTLKYTNTLFDRHYTLFDRRYTLLYTIIHYHTLLYAIIHYYTLLYTIIHYYTLLYITLLYTLTFLIVGGKLVFG